MANPAVTSSKTTAGKKARSRINTRESGDGARVHKTEDMSPVAKMIIPIKEQIDRAFSQNNLELLIAALVALNSRKSAAERESFKNYIFQQLIARLEVASERRKLWGWTRLSAARPEIGAREMSCALLDAFWKDHRKEVERLTLNLARDEDEEVRQYAASTMARIVRANFKQRFRYLQSWCNHPDPSVRRQVIIATVGVTDPKHPERAKMLLDMLEPHLKDRDPYVRRNLGPFALGQGLLRAYPEATLERFQDWLESDDEVVRWNLATALATAVAISQWKLALDVLQVLAADQRRFVWGAASAALGNLMRSHTPEVQPVLRRWMRDPKLRVAVSSAMR
jgi:HEAT repeats